MDAAALNLWQSLAYEIVWRLSATTCAFSTDDVWLSLEHLAQPDDPRALGPILTRCAKEGLIRKSEFVVKSQRRVCHARPVNVWISVFRKASDIDAAAYVADRKSTLTPPSLFTDAHHVVNS